MNSIARKTLLYKTGVEYGDYTMNHIHGCSHGCLYPCYAYLMAKRFGKVKTYSEWIEPIIVGNTLELLDKEIPRLKDKIKSVQLCFTTDPFMVGYPEIEELSVASIRKLNDAGIKCVVLTKGLLPFDLAGLSRENEYGITLVSLDEQYREEVEPGAAPYADRLLALRALHEAGCKTWISMEPYPTPNLIQQDLSVILEAVKFVDRIIFGRANYNKRVTEYKEHHTFYNISANQVIQFCEQNRIQFHIKDKTITEG